MKEYPVKAKFFFDCIFNAIPDYPILRDFTFEEDTDECMNYAMLCERGFEQLKMAVETIKAMKETETDEEVLKAADDALLLCAFLRGEESLEKIDVPTNYRMFKEVFPYHEFSNKYVADHFFTASLTDIREKYVRNLSRFFS